MNAFNPCFTDNITSCDDIVALIILFLGLSGISMFIAAFMDVLTIINHYRLRKKQKREYQFPKYLEDDEE